MGLASADRKTFCAERRNRWYLTMGKSNFSRRWVAPILLVLLTAGARSGVSTTSSDPLAAELARWSNFLRDHTSTDDTWNQVKEAAGPLIARADEALRDGQRFLALFRLSAARMYLSASAYIGTRTAQERKDTGAFEAEWTRVGKVLQADISEPRPRALEGVRPAAVRALAEAAQPQVRIYYESSREYGRDTSAQYGLLYLGAAQAQREFVEFCRTLSFGSEGAPPPLRSLAPELDRLEAELLQAYRPPAAIERHSEFISASSTLKEARELDGLGLRYGALLRYLQAVQRIAPLTGNPAVLEPGSIDESLKNWDSRLSKAGRDDTIGRLFLEAAEADSAHPPAGGKPVIASVILRDVLPRYTAALEPGRVEPVAPPAQVTVTLVRWPYT
jgi:hypothetical protein